jgi:hypothetical protein
MIMTSRRYHYTLDGGLMNPDEVQEFVRERPLPEGRVCRDIEMCNIRSAKIKDNTYIIR